MLGAVAILGVACLALALFMPVFTDEIVWTAAQGRVAEDGGSMTLTFQPSCGPYVIATPALLRPFRFLDGMLYRALDDPLALRVWGVAVAAVWIALALWLVRQLADRSLARGTTAAAVLGFATLGVMPLLLVIDRPEQELLIGLTCFFLPLLKWPAPPPPIGAALLRAAGGVALAGFVLTAHPRGIMAVPLMLVFLWRIARRPAVVAAAWCAVAIFAAVAYRDWAARWACPSDPQFASNLVWVNLASAIETHVAGPYVIDLLRSLSGGGGWYLHQFIPKPFYVAEILPPFDRPLLAGAISVGFAIFLAWAAIAYVVAMLSRAWRDEPFAAAGTGAMWLFYFASVATRIAKSEYEAELMEPVMAMAALGSYWLAWPLVSARIGAARATAAARAGLVALLGLSLVSEAALLVNYIPYAETTWLVPGNTPGQAISISVVGYASVETRAIAAARLCGIDAAAPGEHLVVDEATSFAFRRARQPFFVTFFENGWGQFRPDPTGLWRAEKSAGMIVACERVPLPLQGKVTRSGGFCCLPSFAPS